MEYNEEEAKKIAEKYNISPITINVWKSRGKIPAKYFKEDFRQRKTASTSAEKADYERGVIVLQSEKINMAEIGRISGVRLNMVKDALRKDGRAVMLDYTDYIKIKKELQHLRVKVKKFLDSVSRKEIFTSADVKQADTVLADNRLVIAPLLGVSDSPQAKTAYERTYYRQYKNGMVYEKWEMLLIIDRLSIFLIETAI